MILRHCDYEIDWLLLNLNSLLWSKQLSNTYLESLMLLLNLTALTIILVVSYVDSRKLREKYGWIAERKITVIRNAEMVMLSCEELVVGDVVYPEGEGDFVFWFGGVQVGEVEMVVRESRSHMLKTPIKRFSELEEQKWKKHYIPPFSRVERALLK